MKGGNTLAQQNSMLIMSVYNLCSMTSRCSGKEPARGVVTSTRRPCLGSPGNFSCQESHSKISNLTITELVYSRILKRNRGSIHARSLRRIYLSVFRYRCIFNGLRAQNLSGLSRKPRIPFRALKTNFT